MLTAKRFVDITIAVVSLLVLSPLLAGIALAIRLCLGRPIFFRQKRPGFKGMIFTMYKFRTMADARDSNGRPLPDHKRLTRLGRWLRTTSLDELPELYNVLRGEMSMVGPRPLLPQYLERYSAEQARRHDMKPGVTGWAQVNGRNAIRWEDKFALDVWYIDNWSLLLDLYILVLTVWCVFKREDVSFSQEVTMPEFLGSQSPSGDHP